MITQSSCNHTQSHENIFINQKYFHTSKKSITKYFSLWQSKIIEHFEFNCTLRVGIATYLTTLLQMYCNTVAIIFRMYTVCISVYTVCISVYTMCIQPSYSCKGVVDTTTYSYSQLIIQVAQSYATRRVQLSCNFKNTVNTAEFRIHTIILQMCCNVVATTYTANTTKYNSFAVARLIYNHITLYIQCNYSVHVYSIHTSSVSYAIIQHSYNSLTDVLQHCCNHIRIANTANFAFTQCSHNHLTVAEKLLKRCNRAFHLLVHHEIIQLSCNLLTRGFSHVYNDIQLFCNCNEVG